MNSFTIFTATLCISAVATIGHAQVTEKKVLTLSAAKYVAATAEGDAKARNARVVIAVVDDGGHLLVLERLDDTQVASVNVAIGKARTAAIFRRPSREFEEQIRTGRVAALALPEATPLQGGVPITLEGKVIGAIGVSGETPAQDEEIAIAGATAFNPLVANTNGTTPAASVTYFDSTQVLAAFAQGMSLVETGNYKIHASRREGPGMAEVHELDTDTIYVLEGSATLVTGGTVIEGKTVAPYEIRGTATRDGESQRITKGDVIIVTNGTPHWFQEVEGPLTYYVVKVSSTNGAVQ
jgi:glc operon protein GlcG